MSLVVFYCNKLKFQVAFNLNVNLYLSKITLNAVTMHSESCLNLYQSFFLLGLVLRFTHCLGHEEILCFVH